MSTKKATGIGGVFLRANDVDQMKSWYEDHLGIPQGPYGSSFTWLPRSKPDQVAFTNWSFFKQDSDYYPQEQKVMINFRVENLEQMIAQMREAGVTIAGEIETFEYGKFAWVVDPEGNKIELWEPIDKAFDADGDSVVSS